MLKITEIPSTPTKKTSKPTKYHVRQPKYQPKVFAVLSRGNFCRKFTHFFGVLFTGMKNMVTYQKWQISGMCLAIKNSQIRLNFSHLSDLYLRQIMMWTNLTTGRSAPEVPFQQAGQLLLIFSSYWPTACTPDQSKASTLFTFTSKVEVSFGRGWAEKELTISGKCIISTKVEN